MNMVNITFTLTRAGLLQYRVRHVIIRLHKVSRGCVNNALSNRSEICYTLCLIQMCCNADTYTTQDSFVNKLFLTNWLHMTYASENLVNIGSCNGLAPLRRLILIGTNDNILSFGAYFSEIWMTTRTYLVTKCTQFPLRNYLASVW